MFVAFPAFHVLGVTAVTIGRKESPQFCAWQIAGEGRMNAAEISRKCVAAWGSDLTIAYPNLPKGLRMGAILSWVGYESRPRSGSGQVYPDERPMAHRLTKNVIVGNVVNGGNKKVQSWPSSATKFVLFGAQILRL